jgi:hypothetical protein
MSQTNKKFNYVRWGFLATLIGAIAAVLMIPEFRCSMGLLSDICDVPQKEVDLITQTETGEALAGVKIQVIAKGAPENQYSDSNGYSKVKISSEGDVHVNLSKPGYPSQDFNINLKNDQSTVRTIRFSKSGQSEVSSRPMNPSVAVPTPSPTVSSIQSSGQRFKLESATLYLVDCQKSGRFVKCIFNLASQIDQNVTFGYCGSDSRTRTIFEGKQYLATSIDFGGKNGACGVTNTIIQGVPLKAELLFDELPSTANILSALEISIKSRSGWEVAQYKEVSIK